MQQSEEQLQVGITVVGADGHELCQRLQRSRPQACMHRPDCTAPPPPLSDAAWGISQGKGRGWDYGKEKARERKRERQRNIMVPYILSNQVQSVLHLLRVLSIHYNKLHLHAHPKLQLLQPPNRYSTPNPCE